MTSQEIAEPNTILRCEVGSTLHGIGIGTDDRDEMGICVEPAEYVIGLKQFEQWVHRSKPVGVRSEAGDLDLVIYSARKWCSLALKGNPSVLVLLFAPEDKCLTLEEPARELRDIAESFASKKAGAAFLGYMTQQRQRLTGERGQMNVKRPELVEAHGFDTKYAGHIMRLGFQGIEYMTTGRLTLPMKEEESFYIKLVRSGAVDFNAVLTKAGELEAELRVAIDSSPLPTKPDYHAVNRWLRHTYQEWWSRGPGSVIW